MKFASLLCSIDLLYGSRRCDGSGRLRWGGHCVPAGLFHWIYTLPASIFFVVNGMVVRHKIRHIVINRVRSPLGDEPSSLQPAVVLKSTISLLYDQPRIIKP